MKDIERTDRRDFLQQSVLGVAGAGLAIASITPAAHGDDAEEQPATPFDLDGGVTQKVDVTVIGGGSAGIVAAIQSARAGTRTILVECDSHLGGTTTTGGTTPQHHIHVNRYLFALLAEEKGTEAAVQLSYYETPVRAFLDGASWIVDLAGKGTQARIQCRQLRDCSGNAL
jgi:hypothetical protein